MYRQLATSAVLAGMALAPAQASLSISKRPTQNVTCTNGSCAATATKANLNVTDLANMLAASDVNVVAGSQARDIALTAALSWTSSHGLTLSSDGTIAMNARLAVEGPGALTLITNPGTIGDGISFTQKSKIDFWDTGSALTINGAVYKLETNVPALAADIAANPGGKFALAADYDTKPDGTYGHAPVSTDFTGTLEGLGHTIRNLKIKLGSGNLAVGLFMLQAGPVFNLHLANEQIKIGRYIVAGGLSGICEGDVVGVDATGSIKAAADTTVGGLCGNMGGRLSNSHANMPISSAADEGVAGGLVGRVWFGEISNSYATGNVQVSGQFWLAGGLIGYDMQGSIDTSYASGAVIFGDGGYGGGLVGNNSATINNSFATGATIGGVGTLVGGLVGQNSAAVADSYSSGAVASGSGSNVGGFVGLDTGASDLTDTYWDITTSGQSHGVGNNTAYPGITGLTTEQFQAGLPDGFDPAIWAEDANINGGLPYLLAIPQR